MIVGIPTDDLYKVHPKMSDQEIQKKWALNFFTEDEGMVTTEEEDFKARWERKKNKMKA